MGKYYYATIDKDGNVIASLRTHGDLSHVTNKIPITEELFSTINEKKYNLNTQEWEDNPVKKRKITLSEFFDLFTDEQIKAIDDSQNEKVRAFIFKLKFVSTIDTENPKFETVLNGLEQLGLIGAGEAARILTEAQAIAGGA